MHTRTLLVATLLLVACGGEAPPPQRPSAPVVTPLAPAPVASATASSPTQVCGQPPARTVDTVETKFGITVADPYRWMEGNENAELSAWLRAQGQCTRGYVGRITGRDALFKRLRDLGMSRSRVFDMELAGGRVFYKRIGAGEELEKLVVRESGGAERVLVDPAKLAQGDKHVSVNSYAPSPDGKLIAYDLALGGAEVSQIHVMDVATGNDRPDVIERIWGEMSASWLPDGKSFFYTQLAPAGANADPMLDMEVKLHILGQPVERDVAILGSGVGTALKVAHEEFPVLIIEPGTAWLIAHLGGAHRESRIAVAPLTKLDRSGAGNTPWHTVAEYSDQVESAKVHGDRLYMRTFKDASNHKIISVPLTAPDLSKARVEVPEAPDAIIMYFGAARDAAYVETMVGGRARLWRVPWGGTPVPIALPYDGWIDDLATDPLRDGARFSIESWTRPTDYYDVDAKRGSASIAGIAATTTADYSNIVAEEVEATSSDGTAVPLSMLHPKDLPLDGSRPAILYGYGGYGASETPNFSASRLAWLERGGVFAICHVRGGGEKGYKWQVDGTHEHKMNGVHDFEACGQYLIEHKLTSASHLAARGVSMGGALVGRAITDRPDLFAAANIAVGVVNPTRILLAENGANQKMELGDPETEAGFKSVYDMDAFLHVTSGTAYPAVIFTVGVNDKRVAPWMTGKMAARMQAVSTSGRPILVRIDDDAGHGIGSTRDQVFAEQADVDSFFLAAAGDPAFQVR